MIRYRTGMMCGRCVFYNLHSFCSVVWEVMLKLTYSGVSPHLVPYYKIFAIYSHYYDALITLVSYWSLIQELDSPVQGVIATISQRKSFYISPRRLPPVRSLIPTWVMSISPFLPRRFVPGSSSGYLFPRTVSGKLWEGKLQQEKKAVWLRESPIRSSWKYLSGKPCYNEKKTQWS